jgi:signal transduction histidine kinase
VNISNTHQNKSGITRRLARVIFLQLLFISVITVLGVIVAAKVVEGVMMRAALEGEAKHFWDQYERSPDHALPNTDNLLGYLQVEGSNQHAPESLHGIKPGYGRVSVDGKEQLVFAEQRLLHGQKATLYLIFDEESVAALSFYFGVVPLSLVLIVIYLSAYIGFKQSRKAVSPVVALANRLRDFDPKQNRLVDLELSNLKTASIDDEINTLVDSLNTFTSEINEFIDRERRFTRDASHELRTPLTVIRGSAEFLAATSELGANQKKSLDRILRTVHDMNELVTALLLLARGNNELPALDQISVNELVERQLDQLSLTHNFDQHVTVDVQDQAQITVTATRQFAEAVIGNLLRNAFNYTRKGEVTVVLKEGYLEICNRGEGVRPVDAEKIFEPFVRGEEDGKPSGYGVGLDLVKRLCELFNWQVEGEYSVDRGVVFRVTF